MLLKPFDLSLKGKIKKYHKIIKVDSDKSLSIRGFLIGSISQNVSSLKKQTKTPILVGFGIKSRKDVLAINSKTQADGIIIGSALIKKYFDENMSSRKYLVALNKFIKQIKI